MRPTVTERHNDSIKNHYDSRRLQNVEFLLCF